MKLVLDASMALSWLFERQHPKESRLAASALAAVEDAETRVPPLWHTEILNALLVGERRRAVTEAMVIDYLAKLYALPIVTDDQPPGSRRDMVMSLAREHRLSAYDAVYLDLALRTGAALATFDSKLAEASRRSGGKVFEAG